MLDNSSHQLIREIKMQQDLVYAENGNLSVNPEEIRINTIISSVYNLYADHNIISIGKNLIKQYLAMRNYRILMISEDTFDMRNAWVAFMWKVCYEVVISAYLSTLLFIYPH